MRPSRLLVLVLAFALSFSGQAFAEGYNAGDACTAAGTLHTKNDTDATYQLVCNGTVWVLSTTLQKTGNVILGSGEGGTTPSGNTFRGPNGAGTNIAGGTLTIQGGLATGNAASGDIIFKGAPVGSSGTTLQTAATYLTIKGGGSTAGNVGIGTTTPSGAGSTTLEVAGTGGGANQYGSLTLSNASYSGANYAGSIDFKAQGVTFNAIRSVLQSGGAGEGYLLFYSAVSGVLTNTATLTSAGQFQSNSVRVGGGGYGALHEAIIVREGNTGAGANEQISFQDYLNNNISAIRSIYPGGTQTGSLAFLTANAGTATERLRIDSNGRVGIGTSTPAVALDVVGDVQYTGVIADVSDRRKKENIRPLLPGQLENIMRLQPVSFTMKGDERVELGLIAQDVEHVFPSLVTTMPDGTKTMNYIGLISPMAQAIKEQQGQIEKLEDRLSAIESGNCAPRKSRTPAHELYNQ